MIPWCPTVVNLILIELRFDYYFHLIMIPWCPAVVNLIWCLAVVNMILMEYVVGIH
jgi:hypothetical protein